MAKSRIGFNVTTVIMFVQKHKTSIRKHHICIFTLKKKCNIFEIVDLYLATHYAIHDKYALKCMLDRPYLKYFVLL